MAKWIDDIVADIIERAHRNILTSRAYPIMIGCQSSLMKAGLGPVESWELSTSLIKQFLRDEKIKFGDPKYGWDVEAGETIALDYYIDYMEGA